MYLISRKFILISVYLTNILIYLSTYICLCHKGWLFVSERQFKDQRSKIKLNSWSLNSKPEESNQTPEIRIAFLKRVSLFIICCYFRSSTLLKKPTCRLIHWKTCTARLQCAKRNANSHHSWPRSLENTQSWIGLFCLEV